MSTVGYATLPVIPSFDGLQKAIASAFTSAGITSAAKSAGKSASSSLLEGFDASKLPNAVASEFDDGRITTSARNAGGDAASAFVSAATQEAGGISNSLADQLDSSEIQTAARRGGEKAGASTGGGVASGLGGSGSEISSVLTGLVVTAGVSAGLLGGAVLVEGITDAIARGLSSDKLAAQVGIFNPEQQAELGRIAGGLYANAFGESIDDINTTLRAIFTNGLLPEDAGEADVTKLSELFLNFQTTFGTEAVETARAVGTLIRTGLAQDAEGAFDLLTRGFQQTGDPAGDLLDTVNEYSTQFRKLGLDGGTSLGILQQGFEGGARDLDIVADSLKEFSIRAVDGSQLTHDAFTILGFDAKKMGERIGAGGEEATSALDETLDRLRNVEDPVARAQIAVALFGTQAEDLGDALFAIDPSEAVNSLGVFAGAAEQTGDTLNDNLGTKLESIKRKLEPGSLFAAFQQGGFEGVKTQISGAIGEIGALWDQYGPEVRAAFDQVKTIVSTWWDENGPTIMGKLGEWFRSGLDTGLTAVQTWWNENGPIIIENARTWWTETGQPALQTLFSDVLRGAGQAGIDALKEFFKNPDTWKSMFELTDDIVNLPFRLGANLGISLINGLISKWNELRIPLPEIDLGWFGKVGGGFLDTPDIPLLPKAHSGLMVPGGASTELPFMLQGGERVLSRAEVAAGAGPGAGFNVGGITIVGSRSDEQTATRMVNRLRQTYFLANAKR